MPCNSPNFSYWSQVPTENVARPGEALNADDTIWLIVSNNPETNDGPPPTAPTVLYRGAATLANGTQRFRLFLWHLADFDTASTYGFMIRCQAGGAVSNINRDQVVVDFTDPSVPGTCLADAQLNSTLAAVTGTVNLTDAGATVWSVAVPAATGHRKLVACVMEFDVSVGAGASIEFQTYFSFAGQNRPTFALPVEDIDDPDNLNGHVRGWWPRSAMRIQLAGPNYDVNPSLVVPLFQHTGVCEKPTQNVSPPELDATFGFSKLPGADHVKDTNNNGAYGVNLTYVGGFFNTNATLDGRGYVTLRSRNIPEKYWGCAHVSIPALFWIPGKTRKIPWDLEVPNDANAFNLLELSGAPPPNMVDYVFVAKGTTTTPVPIEIRIANGGAAALPVGIFRFRANLLTEPIGGPPV